MFRGTSVSEIVYMLNNTFHAKQYNGMKCQGTKQCYEWNKRPVWNVKVLNNIMNERYDLYNKMCGRKFKYIMNCMSYVNLETGQDTLTINEINVNYYIQKADLGSNILTSCIRCHLL